MGRCRQSTGAGFQCVYVCVWWRGAETGEDFPVYSKPTENALLPVEVSVGSLWFLKGKERKKELELKHAERFFFFFLILYWICCNIASTPCLCFLAEGHARGVPAPQPWTEPAKSQPLDHKESPQSASWGVGRWGVRLSMGFRVFREALSPWNISDRTIWGVEVEGTGTT